jgi:lactate dehydrogenase-like 2-hydroxyacid dehydrogenase
MPIPSVTDDIFLLQEAILINCSRGPVIDEAALVDHLRENPMFRVGLDVFEVIEHCLIFDNSVCLYNHLLKSPCDFFY